MIKFLLESFSAGIFIYVACVEMLASEFSSQNTTQSTNGLMHDRNVSFENSNPVNKWNGIAKAFAVCLGALVSFFVSINVHAM